MRNVFLLLFLLLTHQEICLSCQLLLADPSIYPVLAGTYSGTIVGLSFSVRISMLLSGVQQSQGNISGYIILGPTILGSGPFSGSIDIAKHLRFTVTDSSGYALLFFEGVMQSATSLCGDYYRCSRLSLARGSRCSQTPSSYGIWDIISTPTHFDRISKVAKNKLVL